ncbi:hypothetical protein SDC9_177938 [bioreactor metagenome]|uniref:Uncharacterized protein n=1 Tax=bioreactor metagenome TaxID=1076179 RepID=A0A645GUP2_9ZZZZ
MSAENNNTPSIPPSRKYCKNKLCACGCRIPNSLCNCSRILPTPGPKPSSHLSFSICIQASQTSARVLTEMSPLPSKVSNRLYTPEGNIRRNTGVTAMIFSACFQPIQSKMTTTTPTARYGAREYEDAMPPMIMTIQARLTHFFFLSFK